jgi:hypothetical protein
MGTLVCGEVGEHCRALGAGRDGVMGAPMGSGCSARPGGLRVFADAEGFTGAGPRCGRRWEPGRNPDADYLGTAGLAALPEAWTVANIPADAGHAAAYALRHADPGLLGAGRVRELAAAVAAAIGGMRRVLQRSPLALP